ncbi:probable maltase-glucoamylase 2 isoform X2 [Dermacentor albipictus]|uniref:probable maltase-glucoamylase 2 isoform X2 n=1 Tax=Dermacentor albipictus TaxID=60249 RepID=UPI0038FC02A5
MTADNNSTPQQPPTMPPVPPSVILPNTTTTSAVPTTTTTAPSTGTQPLLTTQQPPTMPPVPPSVILPNTTTTSAVPTTTSVVSTTTSVVSTTTSVISTTTSVVSTTTTTALFKKKPLLVCHLLSPTQFDGVRRSEVMSQVVPRPTFCDYTILDLPMLPGTIYSEQSYNFLKGATAGHKFLFHIPIQPSKETWFQDLINTQDFITCTANIQTALRPNKVHGFGTINGLGLLESTMDDQAMIAYLDIIYKRFSNVVSTTGTAASAIKNFYAFKPSSSVIRDTYVQYLTTLNSVMDIGLVIILTITDENMPEVYPSSAWDATCLPDLGQPNMFDAVSAILQVPNPNVNFSLALSLRFDLFNEADFSKLHATTLSRIACTSHKAFWFTTTCWHHLYRKDPTGASIHYIGGDKCAFAESSDTTGAVISLETRATIRHKESTASRHQQSQTPAVWEGSRRLDYVRLGKCCIHRRRFIHDPVGPGTECGAQKTAVTDQDTSSEWLQVGVQQCACGAWSTSPHRGQIHVCHLLLNPGRRDGALHAEWALPGR